MFRDSPHYSASSARGDGSGPGSSAFIGHRSGRGDWWSRLIYECLKKYTWPLLDARHVAYSLASTYLLSAGVNLLWHLLILKDAFSISLIGTAASLDRLLWVMRQVLPHSVPDRFALTGCVVAIFAYAVSARTILWWLPPNPPGSRGRLIHIAGPFEGRQEDLNYLREHVGAGQSVWLTGIPGMGTSTLGRKWTENAQARGDFADGIAYIACQGRFERSDTARATPTTTDEVRRFVTRERLALLRDVLTSLDIFGWETALADICKYETYMPAIRALRAKKVLVVLDNLSIEAYETIHPVIEALQYGNAAVLITTSTWERTKAEVPAPYHNEDIHRIDPLRDEEALELFAHFARQGGVDKLTPAQRGEFLRYYSRFRGDTATILGTPAAIIQLGVTVYTRSDINSFLREIERQAEGASDGSESVRRYLRGIQPKPMYQPLLSEAEESILMALALLPNNDVPTELVFRVAGRKSAPEVTSMLSQGVLLPVDARSAARVAIDSQRRIELRAQGTGSGRASNAWQVDAWRRLGQCFTEMLIADQSKIAHIDADAINITSILDHLAPLAQTSSEARQTVVALGAAMHTYWLPHEQPEQACSYLAKALQQANLQQQVLTGKPQADIQDVAAQIEVALGTLQTRLAQFGAAQKALQSAYRHYDGRSNVKGVTVAVLGLARLAQVEQRSWFPVERELHSQLQSVEHLSGTLRSALLSMCAAYALHAKRLPEAQRYASQEMDTWTAGRLQQPTAKPIYERGIHAEAQARAADARAREANEQGRAAEVRSEYEQAMFLYGRALKAFEDVYDVPGQAEVLQSCWQLACSIGYESDALTCAEQLFLIASAAGYTALTAQAQTYVEERMMDTDDAEPDTTAADVEPPDIRGPVASLIRQGLDAQLIGNLDLAAKYLEEAADDIVRGDEQRGRVRMLIVLKYLILVRERQGLLEMAEDLRKRYQALLAGDDDPGATRPVTVRPRFPTNDSSAHKSTPSHEPNNE